MSETIGTLLSGTGKPSAREREDITHGRGRTNLPVLCARTTCKLRKLAECASAGAATWQDGDLPIFGLSLIHCDVYLPAFAPQLLGHADTCLWRQSSLHDRLTFAMMGMATVAMQHSPSSL